MKRLHASKNLLTTIITGSFLAHACAQSGAPEILQSIDGDYNGDGLGVTPLSCATHPTEQS